MRTLAVELAPHRIRCNALYPSTVNTDMVDNPAFYEFAGVPGGTRAEAEAAFKTMHALPIAQLEAVDISNMVLFLAFDESRYITGTTQVLDAGATAPFKIPHV
jgi:(+)-trans-carveol dehydrogenase